MGKKDKDATPNPTSIPNKDILQRLNFLYQASVYLTNLSQVVPSTEHNPTRHGGVITDPGHETLARIDHTKLSPECNKKMANRRKRKRNWQCIRTADELARVYVDTLTKVGKRATVKMDPSIKRTLCKACKNVLVPGLSVVIRVRRSTSHRHAVELKCATCGYGRRIPAPPRGLAGVSSPALEEGTGFLACGDSADEDAVEDEGLMGREEEGQEGQEIDVAAVQAEGLSLGEQPWGNEQAPKTREKELQNDGITKGAGREKRKRRRKDRDRMAGAGTGTGMARIYLPLPLALRRDAGHLVFCGNERVDVDVEGVMKEFGDGVFAV